MSTAVIRRIRLVFVAMSLLAMIGCRQELVGRPAPLDTIFFPLGMAIHPTLPLAYVISTNWSQRFNTGWIQVIDLAALAEGQATSPLDVIVQTLLVPSLGGELSISDDGTLLVAGFRNNSQMIVFEVHADGTIDCGDPGNKGGLNANDRRTDCDARHLYTFVQNGADKDLIIDQFRAPYGARFLPPEPGAPPDALPTIAVGFLLTDRAGQGLVTFLDVDITNGAQLLQNQRSIDLQQGNAAFIVQSTAIVAPRPTYGAETTRFVAVGARTAIGGVTSATIFGVDPVNYDYGARLTDTTNDDFNNRMQVANINIRAEAGGFTFADLQFTPDDGTPARAFAAISFPQPAVGSSDSVIMMDATPRSRQVVMADGSIQVIERPEYDVLDTLAVPGTPQSVAYVKRVSAPPLLVTATFDDNALHFVRVGQNNLDALTRIDRQVGQGPVTVRHARFVRAEPGATTESDFILVASFLTHELTIFDVTSDNPANWGQAAVQSTLPPGRRFH